MNWSLLMGVTVALFFCGFVVAHTGHSSMNFVNISRVMP